MQPELARTLERIARLGAQDFYEGETARCSPRDMAEHGGLITLDDLKNYAVVERKPLDRRYRGYDIITAPPPSSGGVGILQMLGVLEGTGYEKAGAGSAADHALHGRGHAPLLRRPRRVPGRSRFRARSRSRPARSRVHRAAARSPSIPSAPRPAPGSRRASLPAHESSRDHALLDRRRARATPWR